jgi:hypothetical protein
MLHRMKLKVALPTGFDMDSVDRRVEAILDLARTARLPLHHERKEGDLRSSEVQFVQSADQAPSSKTTAASASLVTGNDENDMRMELLTPKAAVSRKKSPGNADSSVNGGNVSMQVLRIESISKMNKQLQNGMQDIRNSAFKVSSAPMILSRTLANVCRFQN